MIRLDTSTYILFGNPDLTQPIVTNNMGFHVFSIHTYQGVAKGSGRVKMSQVKIDGL